MKNLSCWLIILLHLQCIFPEKNGSRTQYVYGIFGEEATLKVSVVETKLIRQIMWVTSGGVHVATSQPGGQVEIREEIYEERLIASTDGSLVIKDLRMEDSGTIKATIYLLDGEDSSETFVLKITGTCGETQKVSAPIGTKVTLQVGESHIESVLWERPVGVIFATTKPGGFIDVRGDHFIGRLEGSSNGSLTVMYLKAQDQGDYRAFIFPPSGVGCAHKYHVIITSFSSSLRSDAIVYKMSGVVLTLATLYATY